LGIERGWGDGLHEMADVLRKGHTLLKTRVSTDINTGRYTKVKAV